MYTKHTVTLWTDEMVYARSAMEAALERHSKGWRKTFIELGANIAEVYLPSIRALQSAIETFDKVLPPK